MHFPTPLKSNSIKIMLLGSGELGKEVAIEAQRLGIEVVAVDRYANAPAHQVAHEAHVIDMQNKDEVLDLIRRVNPTYICLRSRQSASKPFLKRKKRGFMSFPTPKRSIKR